MTILLANEILVSFQKEIKKCRRASFAMALLTHSGLDLVEESLRKLLDRGGRIRMLVGYDLPTDPASLRKLSGIRAEYPSQVEVRAYHSGRQGIFHPKFLLFEGPGRRTAAILGSSNLTVGGWKENQEANILVTDPGSFRQLDLVFEELFLGAHSQSITDPWIDEYEHLWNKRKKIQKQFELLQRAVRQLKSHEPRGPRRVRGHRFAFTGGIAEFPRERRLYRLVKELGGSIVRKARSMKSSDCLVHAQVHGDRDTTLKLTQARKKDIPIITEEDFFGLVKREQRLKNQKK